MWVIVCPSGVLLAIFEEFGIIQAFQGRTNLSVGTVAAGRTRENKRNNGLLWLFFLLLQGWQNFFVCIEMCLASIALRFAFPHQPYVLHENYLPTISGQQDSNGRIVTMQSISNNLKETMNPKDIMHGNIDDWKEFLSQDFVLDAIHNFHPQYRDYTQYNAQVRSEIVIRG